MHKKIAFGVGLLMTISPLIASAQDTQPASVSSLIAYLQVLVIQLEQQLAQLIAAKNSAPVSQMQTSTSSGALGTSAPQCSAYANLQRGDTDATTNGQVSQLQSFLGISPTTGYYGAQTAIGYNNVCVGGNSQPLSVPGMSEYKTADFTFWYPGSWTIVQKNIIGLPISIDLKDPNGKTMMVVEETVPPSGEIGNYIDANDSEGFYFDSNAGAWMYSRTSGGNTTNGRADLSENTMGGLHMFTFLGLMYDDIVPLSATHFVDITDTSYTKDVRPLARTIVAANVNVATPVSTAQQYATIQAEGSAYGVQTGSTPALQTYTNSTYGFSIQYPGTFPIHTTPASQQSFGAHIQNGTALLTIGQIEEDFIANEPGWGTVGTTGKVTVSISTDPGDVRSCMTAPGATEETPENINTTSIHGVNFLSYHITDPAAGLLGEDQTYTTLHNGICYSINAHMDGVESGHLTGADQTSNDTVQTQVMQQLDTVARSFQFVQ